MHCPRPRLHELGQLMENLSLECIEMVTAKCWEQRKQYRRSGKPHVILRGVIVADWLGACGHKIFRSDSPLLLRLWSSRVSARRTLVHWNPANSRHEDWNSAHSEL